MLAFHEQKTETYWLFGKRRMLSQEVTQFICRDIALALSARTTYMKYSNRLTWRY
jgi:hypothetical protein